MTVHGLWWRVITQEEKWNNKFEEIVSFVETNKRNPSKYVPDEKSLLNWTKQQRKLVNKSEYKAEGMEQFRKLLEIAERYRHVNQYQ